MSKKMTENRKSGVAVSVPRGEDVYICINGKGWLLPAMQVSTVPPEVAAEYFRSERAKDRFCETSAVLSAQ